MAEVTTREKELEDEIHDIELAAERFLAAYLSDDPKTAYLSFQLQAVLNFFKKRRKDVRQ